MSQRKFTFANKSSKGAFFIINFFLVIQISVAFSGFTFVTTFAFSVSRVVGAFISFCFAFI
jgi:hypothetical protein